MRGWLAILLFVSTPALAQERMSWGERNQGEISGMAQYATTLTVGGSHEFSPRFGWIGFSGEVNYQLLPMLSVGVTSGYQLSYTKVRDTLVLDNAALNATQFRYLDLVPIFAQARYYLELGDSPVIPYGGLGIGTVYANREIDVGVEVVTDGWHFGFAPQLGAMLVTEGPNVMLDVEFTGAVKSGDAPGEAWMTFELGLLFD